MNRFCGREKSLKIQAAVEWPGRLSGMAFLLPVTGHWEPLGKTVTF